jgi:hypothetical protein
VFAACFRRRTNEYQELSLPNPSASPRKGKSTNAEEHFLYGSATMEDGESVDPVVLRDSTEDRELENHISISVDDEAEIVVPDDIIGNKSPSKESENEEPICGYKVTVAYKAIVARIFGPFLVLVRTLCGLVQALILFLTTRGTLNLVRYPNSAKDWTGKTRRCGNNFSERLFVQQKNKIVVKSAVGEPYKIVVNDDDENVRRNKKING